MALNLGLDGKVDALVNATDASEWNDALIELLRAGLLSDRNPFGALARQSLATLKIRPGAVIPWSGGTSPIPDGWLLCDGSYVGRQAYLDLYARLGSRHGPLQGGNFKLPDLRRKVVIGWGRLAKPAKSLGPETRIGATGGREQVTLGSATIPAHGHLLAGSATGIELVAVGSHTHQVYEFTTPTNATYPGNFVARRDYLSNSTSATILDQADRHIHFLGGHSDRTGSASPAPITTSGLRLTMHWLIKT